MKPIYVLIKKGDGGFSNTGGRKVRAYTSEARAKAYGNDGHEVVTYEPVSDKDVVISKDHYDYVQDRAYFLTCLESAGVDNWSGYGDAYEIYEGEDE